MLIRHQQQVLNKTSRKSIFLFVIISSLTILVLPKCALGSGQDLRSGGTVVGELTRGAEQLFEITLDRGEFFQLSIIKGDLNLSVALVEPGDRQLLEFVSHSYETVDLGVVADSPGPYLLKVRSLEISEGTGRFELRVQPVRIAVDSDVHESVARLALAAASQLCADWTEDSFHKAIEKYDEASRAWRSARNFRGAAEALMRAGETYFILGKYEHALESYKKAALELRNGRDRLLTAEVNSRAGRLHSLLGDNDTAQKLLTADLNYYSENVTDVQSIVFKHARAQTLSSLAEVSYSKGNLVRLSNFVDSSLKLFQETGDRNGEARSLLFAGYLADSIGGLDKAITNFNQARDLYRQMGNRSGEALSITAVGITHSLERKDEAGITLHHEAMEMFRRIGDRQSEAITVNAIGQAYYNLNQKPLALEHYKQALKLFRDNGAVDFTPVPVYQIAALYRETGDEENALAYYEECIKLSRLAKKQRMEAYALNDVAAIYVTQGKREKALSQYHRVLRFYALIGDHRGQALALNNIGDLYLSWGRHKEGLSAYKLALPLSQQSGERGIEIATLYNVARTERDAGALDAAKSHIESSIEVIENLRTNVASPDFRSSYFSGVRKHYDLYIDLLMQLDKRRPGQGFAAAALLASERARARSLIEILAEANADVRQGVDPALLKRERELQNLLSAETRYQLEVSNSKEANSDPEMSQKFDQLKGEYEALQGQIRNQNPRNDTLMRPRALTVAEIQAQLGQENTILLEYALGDERSYVWAVTPNSLTGYELPSRKVLEDIARELYASLTARQLGDGIVDQGYQARVQTADGQAYEKALDLSQKLLGPIAKQLGDKRLLIVAEGALQYIPFDALPIPSADGMKTGEPKNESNRRQAGSDQWRFPDRPLLISQHEIISLPSISTLAAIRAEASQQTSSAKLVAVFADPVFSISDERVPAGAKRQSDNVAAVPQITQDVALRDFRRLTNRGDFTRLAHAAEEADAIEAAASGDAWIVKGFAASREQVLGDQTAQYRIVHFATHGIVNTEHPELSGIVLTMIKNDGSTDNGFLQLHDIYNLRLSAELTVLSACDTGLGKDIRGEGLMGLTRGFMFAGSRSVVASLWKVDDRATAVLMSYFYKAMLQKGLPPAAALRWAKQELRKEPAWQAPFFWAGFVLQGEYDRPISVSPKHLTARKPWLLLLITAVVVGFLIWQARNRRARAAQAKNSGPSEL
jgi:CHAT domain-containing protein/predicted negative regulator of RcsB-dependent stress response